MDTTDPALESFIEVAPDSHFPIQNLPYGVFRPRPDAMPRVGVAIGEHVLDLSALESRELFDHAEIREQRPFSQPALNAFMAMGPEAWQAARAVVSHLLRASTPTLRDDADFRARALFDRHAVEMLLPAHVGDYTDFYSSKEHATNVGTMFRGPENALKPNWTWLPVGYHGRASSLLPSGQHVRRPCGQKRPPEGERPPFGPSERLDFELEMGFFVGPGNALGEPISVADAEEHIFGLALVNDWSARDIQAWEYVPLGPFLGKNFATTVSPWVVPMEALEPFRTGGPAQDPAPLDYLKTNGPGAYDVHLEAAIQTEKMDAPHVLCRTNLRHLYWSMAQQLAHHSVGGCNMRPGDLLASGTISGPTPESFGSLLELTWNGDTAIELPSGEQRTFLEDGDRLTLTGYAQGEGYRVGFGEAGGRILPAPC